ncbi:MAG TPA: sodium:proton antiporter [Verrucomicrobiae bacterium]|nr:sodium:proton antiporter [Verrucomicrobiae bacterium]
MRGKAVTLAVFFGTLDIASVATGAEITAPREPHVLMVAPFVILLLAIALLPFVLKHHWENHYPKVAIGLGLITTVYYVVVLHNTPRMLLGLIDYVGFIALIGSLYVIAGGIHIDMTGRSTPTVNTGLLALGVILANLLGTTGASMLLIRPFLRINKPRIAPYHVVFFIFLVSNIGGALTPIGDPPLFLGYLKGVPFFWLMQRSQVLLAWLLCVGVLLALFFVIDSANFRKHKPAVAKQARDRVELEGSHNFLWLFVIIVLVLAQKGEWVKDLEHWSVLASLGDGLGWSAVRTAESFTTLFMALLMIGTAGLSHKFANHDALKKNQFDFEPLREVGLLFVGIFATMVPALDLLEKHAAGLGLATVRQFFWGSGLLSSMLDNAPAYLSFLAAAFGLRHLSLENPAHVQAFLLDLNASKYVVAVSLGSVFFGAVTYIGNGPNFMVKSIAESAGVKCPGFFGYVVKYALPILIPLFALVSWLLLA